jgi:translation initiation factor 2 subunit 1
LFKTWQILGYIDLSKRRVSAEDVVKCEERYNKSKTYMQSSYLDYPEQLDFDFNLAFFDGLCYVFSVSSIVRHVSEKTELDMETINEMVAWPLFEKYGHAFDAFKLSIT